MALKQITAKDFKEAVDSLNNGSTCWRKILGRTDEGTELCFVIGWSDAGYDEDDAKKNGYFDDGYTICSKIACQSRYNGSLSDFDGDFTMPYDKETGDVWDTSTMVSNNESDWESDAKSYNEDAQAMWDTYCVPDDDGLTALDAMVESKKKPESKQSKGCSMKRKIESLGKKNEAFTLPRDVADAMKLVKDFLEKNKDDIVDEQLVSDADAAVGYQIELAVNVLTDLVANAPKGEAKQPEAKKSEAVDDSKTIKMNVDYNTFMRLCSTAAYLTSDENYWDALWEYYSDFGEITEEANVFFDNLFQYTDWKSEEDLYDESLPEKYKDGSKSKAECIQSAVEDGAIDATEYADGMYLIIQ